MERVVGVEGERVAFSVLEGEDADVGIGGTGGAIEDVGAGAWVHLDGVEFAEGVERHLAGFEVPAPVEHFVRERV